MPHKMLDKVPAFGIAERKIERKDVMITSAPAARPAHATIQPNSMFWFYFYSGTRGGEGRV
jgi:hypothetical protein